MSARPPASAVTAAAELARAAYLDAALRHAALRGPAIRSDADRATHPARLAAATRALDAAHTTYLATTRAVAAATTVIDAARAAPRPTVPAPRPTAPGVYRVRHAHHPVGISGRARLLAAPLLPGFEPLRATGTDAPAPLDAGDTAALRAAYALATARALATGTVHRAPVAVVRSFHPFADPPDDPSRPDRERAAALAVTDAAIDAARRAGLAVAGIAVTEARDARGPGALTGGVTLGRVIGPARLPGAL